MRTEPYLDLVGMNCWTVVAKAYLDELGIDLPSYEEVLVGPAIGLDPERKQAIDAVWPAERDTHWTPVADGEEREFDLVDMRVLGRSHVGLVLDPPMMLHQMGKTPKAVNYRSAAWRHRIRGFFRHPSLT